VPLKIGALTEPRVLLALFGFVVITTLLARGVRGALLVGMWATAALGLVLGFGRAPEAVFALPFTGELSLAPIALQLDVLGALRPSLLPVLLTLFLMGVLDTLGTLLAVGASGGMLDEKGRFPEIEKPMLVDAVSCMASGLIGTSTSGAYIESATGIREGARTGLASVVTAGLFLLSLFFVPLFATVQELRFAYAPALVAVGALMATGLARVDYQDLTELVPAFASIAFMVFTYNIANGLAAGLVLHPLGKLLAGRGREVAPGGIVFALLCLAYFGVGLPH
jgi:AGZA family xanthine/uracil permease-like MFS transporter